MIIKYLFIRTFIIYYIIIITLIWKVCSEKKTIEIILKDTDMPYFMDYEAWDEKYQNITNQFLKERFQRKLMKNEVEIIFNFFPYMTVNPSYDSEYKNYLAQPFGFWKNGSFDMALLDDRMLYSDKALMRTHLTDFYFDSFKPTEDYLLDLTKYVSKKDLKHHDPEILKHSYYKKHIYGLPYEKDFDVLYYIRTNEKAVNIIKSIETMDWDEFYNQTVSQRVENEIPLIIAGGDEDNFTNLFFEYINSKYDIDFNEKNYFEQVLLRKSEEKLTSYQKFVNDYTGNNVNNTLHVDLDTAFYYFMNQNTPFFRGKASHSILSKN